MKTIHMKVCTYNNVLATEVCIAITTSLPGLTEAMLTQVLCLQLNTLYFFLGKH